MMIFLYTGIVVASLTLILFLTQRPFKLTNAVASMLVVFVSLPMIDKLLMTGVLHIPIPAVFVSVKSYPFTYGPLLYLYIKFHLDPVPAFKKKYLLHFLPFIIFAIASVCVSIMIVPEPPPGFGNRMGNGQMMAPPPMQGGFAKPPGIFVPGGEMPSPPDMPPEPMDGNQLGKTMPNPPGRTPENPTGKPYDFLPPGHIAPDSWYLFILPLSVSFIVYTLLIFALLRSTGKPDKSSGLYKISLRFKLLTFCFMISYLFIFFSILLGSVFKLPVREELAPDIALVFFIFMFYSFSIKHTDLGDMEQDEYPNNGDNDGNGNAKYRRSGLKEETARDCITALENYMISEKPFLNSEISIFDISEKLNISRHHLTQAINEIMHKNFSAYLNEYRVEEAKRLLTDNSYTELNIINIAFESGFNSKSGFNLVFKKFTGYTPKEYRRNAMKGAGL